MTCRKVQRLLPLFVGGDLRPRLTAPVGAHLESCPGCAEELRGYRESLTRLKAAAEAESVPDWTEGEWRALAARFRTGAPGTERAPLRARPRWAVASVLGAALGLAVLAVLIKDGNQGARGTAAPAGPSVVSLTLISQESGLQVVWFLNKDFEWKGDKN